MSSKRSASFIAIRVTNINVVTAKALAALTATNLVMYRLPHEKKITGVPQI